MSKNCTYSFKGPDGQDVTLTGQAAIKAFLVNGGLQYLREPEVRASKARDITDTPEFKKWFGDSKVVDSEGEPLVVYHATDKEFAEFDIERGDLGAHFGTAEQAQKIASYWEAKKKPGARTIPVYLSLQNPIRLEDRGAWSGPAVAPQLQKMGLLPDDLPPSNWSGAEGRDAVRRAIQRAGYDGVVYANTREGDGDSYIALRPEQIKSAIGNTGAFATDNPDITRSAERFTDDQRDALEQSGRDAEEAIRSAPRNYDVDLSAQQEAEKPAKAWIEKVYAELPRNPMVPRQRIMMFGEDDFAVLELAPSGLNPGGVTIQWIQAYPLRSGNGTKAIRELQRLAAEDGIELDLWPWDKGRVSQSNLIKFYKSVGFEPMRRGSKDMIWRPEQEARRSTERGLWYSQLARAIDSVPARLDNQSGIQWAQWLKANAAKLGVKQDEITWSGIEDFLKLKGKEKVSKDEIGAYLAEGGVRVEEVVLGGPQVQAGYRVVRDGSGWNVEDPNGSAIMYPEPFESEDEAEAAADRLGAADADEAQSDTKYGEYTLPGGSNYRELLLTLPESRPLTKAWRDAQKAYGDDDQRTIDAKRAAKAEAGPQQGYKSAHWEQKNILAHIRLNDRTDAKGRRVLFVEELQSDFAQDARKKGFKQDLDPAEVKRLADQERRADDDLDSAKSLLAKYKGDWQAWLEKREKLTRDPRSSAEDQESAAAKMREAMANIESQQKVVDDLGAALDKVMREHNEYRRKADVGLPRAPFIDDTSKWLSLALKRVIKMAVDEGYDAVAFVNGEQSADRYDLSKQLDTVLYDRRKNGSGGEVIGRKDGYNAITKEILSDDELADVVGKEVAKKLLEAPLNAYGMHELKGLDLKVGGEGMLAFYNAIVPQAASALVKKMGGEGMTTLRVGMGKPDKKTDGLGFDESELQIRRGSFGWVIERGEQFMRAGDGKYWDGSGWTTDEGQTRVFATKEEAEASATASPQPGFLITDSMREKASGPMPLFSRERGWDGFPDAVIASPLSAQTKDADYVAAKAGDAKAASRLVGRVLPQEAIDKVRQMIGDLKPVVVPVSAEEAAGRNKIPLAAATRLGAALGLDIDVDIVQATRARRSGADGMARLGLQPEFDGQVQGGRDYLLVDDTLTQGGTLAQLKTYVEAGGGRVIGAFALGGKQYSAKIGLDADTISRLRDKYGSIEDWWRSELGYGFHGLTQSEARYILASGLAPEALRDRVAAARREAGVGRDDARLSRERTETPEFKAWSGDAKLVKIGDAITPVTFKSGQPVVVEALHGTTHDITEFKRSKANIESDWGGGFYASNTPSDVMRNYANEEGPDLKLRIELMAERIADDEGFEGDMDEARSIARARLSGGAPNTMKLFVRFRNPAVVGGRKETKLEFEEEYDEEADSYGEPTGKLIEFVEALDWIAPNFNASRGDIERARDAILGKAYDTGEGVSLTDIADAVKEHLVDTQSDDGQGASGEILRLALKEIGFDGVIDTTVYKKFKSMPGMKPDTVHFIAFEPNQLKSAIGNDGSYDETDPNILSSAARNWESPGAAKFDDLVQKFQDKHVDLLRVQQAVQETGKAIANDRDVYLKEELFHGRAAKRTEDFTKRELEPLTKEMADRGLTIEELDEYLHARHAPEANRLVAERNPGVAELQDGGSGMTNQQAADYMVNLPADKRDHLQAVSAQVDKILAKTRDLMVDYELESRDTVKGWGEMFQHYVPLMREDDGDAPARIGTGQGFSIKGREVKSRTGSTKKVVDILANIAMQRERVIVRGEKNRVGQALVNLALENPNDDFWSVDITPRTPTYDPAKGVVVMRPDPMFKMRPNVVVAKFKELDGSVQEHAVIFNEKDARAVRMAASLKNLEAARMEGFLGASAAVTRYFSAIVTQFNPVFGVINFMRDFQGVMLNLKSTPLDGMQRQIAKDALRSVKHIYSNLRTGKEDTELQRLWDEFREVGGQTGFRQMFADSGDRADALREAINPDSWTETKLGKIFTANGVLKVPMAKAMRGSKALFQWLTDYNDTLENATRLAVYKAGKEKFLAEGMEAQAAQEKAASIAKNISVNFNRKGELGQQIGSLYAFFNASAQGTARLGQLLFDMEPGKPNTIRLSRVGKRIVAGGLLLGVAQALALSAAGFSDDDPPEFVRERSIVIPTGGKSYVAVPMPLGLHVLPNLGRVTTEWGLSGFDKTPQRLVGLLGLFAEAFVPTGSSGLSMQTLAPTALDPLVALTENKDWQGRPIAKESLNPAVPGHALVKDTATAWSRGLAYFLNYASGGNEYVRGAVSPTPDQLDYLVSAFGGGVAKEISKVQQTASALISGEELPTYKMPLVGRLVGNAASQQSEGTAFYSTSKKLNELETEIKGLQKDGKYQEAMALRQARPEAYLITQVNRAERDISKLRRQKSELIANGAPRDQVRAIEEQITARMAAFNRASEALKARQQTS